MAGILGRYPHRPQAQGLLGLDPNIATRGALLPLGRTQSGELEFAMPEILIDMARAATLPGRVVRGEGFTPEDVTRMALDVAAPGVTGSLLRGAPGLGILGQNMFHGGPHRWAPEPGFPQGRPRLDKIGTGEGAQAYGWGFYSAEALGVARAYRESLTSTIPGAPTGSMKYQIQGVEAPTGRSGHAALDTANDIEGILAYHHMKANPMFGAEDFDPSESIKYLKESIERRIARHRQDTFSGSAHDDMEALARFYEDHVKNVAAEDVVEARGALYALDLPDEDVAKYLDWDAPLSEQPEAVKKAIASLNRNGEMDDLFDQFNMNYEPDTMTGAELYQTIKRAGEHDYLPPLDIEYTRALRSDERASLWLGKAGIPGLKYYDQMSRGASPASIKRIEDNLAKARARLAEWKKSTHSVAPEQRNSIEAEIGRLERELARANEARPTHNYVTWDQDVLDRATVEAR